MKLHKAPKRIWIAAAGISLLLSITACSQTQKNEGSKKVRPTEQIQEEIPEQEPSPEEPQITEEPVQESTVTGTDSEENPTEEGSEEEEAEVTQEAVESINDTDFTITDDEHIVSLRTLFSDFVPAAPELEVPNNFVSSEIVGELEYKIYTHEYEGYTLYVTNHDYDHLGLEMSDYYISQISLSSDNYHTVRGITIGDALSDLYEKYGEQDVEDEDGSSCVRYEFEDNVLEFRLDDKDQVVQINIYVKN